MENQENISSLLREHSGWQSQLTGFKDELKQLNSELGSFLLKKEPRDIPSDAEHFQNQFILQGEVLDILKHDMKQYENLLESCQQNPEKANATELDQVRSGLQSRLDDFVRLYKELAKDFNAFIKGVEVAL